MALGRGGRVAGGMDSMRRVEDIVVPALLREVHADAEATVVVGGSLDEICEAKGGRGRHGRTLWPG